jgi:hypothetical protein
MTMTFDDSSTHAHKRHINRRSIRSRYDTLVYQNGIYLFASITLHYIALPSLQSLQQQSMTVENALSLNSAMTNRDGAPETSPADSALRPAYSRRKISEPDLTVVVGGERFFHHSVLLCLASEYFDTMLSSDTREAHTGIIEFPDGDPEEWVRFCRYLDPRSLFATRTLHVNVQDAMDLLPWFHQFGMTNLLQECDEMLSIASPKFLDEDLNDEDDRRSTMMKVLVWAETATTYGLSETLDTMVKELKKAIDVFPEMITSDILESMRPFWSTAAGTELWEAVKAKLPYYIKSSHNNAALKASKLLFQFLAQSCKVPAKIRTLKSEVDFNAIVNLMKKYRSCPRIQQNGCAAFRDRILRNDDHRLSSAVKDGIEAILSAMVEHSNVSKVQEMGCAALVNLALNNAANCVSISASHGIEAIVSAMTAHSNESKVQEWGCLALGNIARSNDVNCVSIATHHGIEAIVSAMTAHSNVSKLQEWGCAALGNLALNNEANCVSISARHGIEAIVSAITAHSNVSKVQEWGCLALGNLAWSNDANRISIATKHGIEAIVSAMTAHSSVSKVQEWGCAALGNLALNNDLNPESISSRRGIEAIVSAMVEHSNVSKVQEIGC